MMRPPPRSPLFPYTTLFRSALPPGVKTTLGLVALRFDPGMPSSTARPRCRSEEHTSELQSPVHLVCRLLLEKKKLSLRQQLMTARDFCLVQWDYKTGPGD